MSLYEKFRQSCDRRPRRGIRLSAKEKEQVFHVLDLCRELNNKLTVEKFHHHQLVHIITPMLTSLVEAHACCRKGVSAQPFIEKAIHGFIACMGRDAILALRLQDIILVVDEEPL